MNSLFCGHIVVESAEIHEKDRMGSMKRVSVKCGIVEKSAGVWRECSDLFQPQFKFAGFAVKLIRNMLEIRA